ncbi:hypothetical protein ACWV27_11725 [Massilia varians]|uniref:hypothetical protein n=1 Tax=Massilia sp. LC238 TaxID=1502852 RepID=UPI001269FD37|nr:hypothetical protein [Massilia sp. LC238]
MSLKQYRILAGLLSLIVLILCMVSPLLLHSVFTGTSWDDPVPDWMGWTLVLGGGIGSGLAVLIHLFIISKIGGYSEKEAMRDWHSRYK